MKEWRKARRGVLFLLVVAVLGLWAVRTTRSPLAAPPHPPVAGSEPDFFVDYRLRRDEVRSKEAAMLRQIIDDPSSSPAGRVEANQALLEMSRALGQEMEIESLIKAKGFADAVAIIARGNLVVVVKAGGLTRSEVAEIVDIGKKVTGYGSEAISIIPRAG